MLDKLLSRKCKKCGTPWVVRKLYRWGNDGTMGIKFHDVKRMVFLNSSMYDDIVGDLNLEVGIPIWNLVYESYRNVGTMSLNDMFNENGSLQTLKKLKSVRKRIGTFFNLLAAAMGVCHSVRGERLSKMSHIAYIKNPFNLYCVAGSVVSAMEALWELPFDCSWEELGLNEYKLTVKPMDKKPEICERLIDPPPTITGGNVSFERCPSCGMPLRAVELFEWRMDEGKLINKNSGDRWCCFVTTTLRPVIRELAKELGDEIYDSLISSQCNWTIAHLDRMGITTGNSGLGSEEAREAFLKYLDDFPIFGYGNPVDHNIGESGCSITISNPFFTEQLAGILLGLFEGLYGKQADIEWKKPKESEVTYEIRSIGERIEKEINDIVSAK